MAFLRALTPVLCGSLALAGCSGPDVLNALTPSSGYRLVKDIAYGDGPRRKLDLYVPDGPEVADGPLPTVVYFYGGSWQTGTKDDYRFIGQAFAARGYQVVVPDYRLYPEVRYPDFLEDAAAAVAWVAARAGEAGRRAGPIFLLGHSAGAYNGAMLALDRRWLSAAGVDRDRTVAGFAGLAGPYDFLPLVDPALMEIFGPKDARPLTQPIRYADAGAPPMLLATGADDDTVRPKNSANLAARLRDLGSRVEAPVYDRVGHLMIVAALARPFRFLAPVLDDVDSFFRRRMAEAAHG